MLAISDLHGDMQAARKAIEEFDPELVLCCGDWGDQQELKPEALAEAVQGRTVFSTFGNHDLMETLGELRNADGSKVLMDQGEVRTWKNWRIGAIGGIWAKHPKKPFHVTDEEVRGHAEKMAKMGNVDVLLTHGCARGVADMTPTGPHGGQRCFLEAFETVRPQIYLCGHLHRAQEYLLKDGRTVLNVGQTSNGEVVVVQEAKGRLSARADRIKERT